MTNLTTVLRIVALLIVLMVAAEYVLLEVLMIPPLVVAALLLLLSVAATAFPRSVAVVCMLLSILVPAGAIMGYLEGQLVVFIPIFDVLVFTWLLWIALRTLREDRSANVPEEGVSGP